MKIITWNLGYWQYSSYHDEAWTYLCDDIKPDLALLQEVKPPSWISPEALVFEEYVRGWGTAVYAPSLILSREVCPIYPGRVAAAAASLNDDVSLFVASIHAPIIKNCVFPHLDEILTAVESMPGSRSAVVGGDLNSAKLAEKVWPGYGHGPFFERIERGDRWINCYQEFHDTEVQTFFCKNGIHPFQDDHLFVSCDLQHHLISCTEIHNEITRRVSDHIPLMMELDMLLSK